MTRTRSTGTRRPRAPCGHPDVIAPPTFLTIINLASINSIVTDPELGLDYSRMVHGDQQFSYSRPAHAGDTLLLTTHIDRIMARAYNDFINLRAEITDSSRRAHRHHARAARGAGEAA